MVPKGVLSYKVVILALLARLGRKRLQIGIYMLLIITNINVRAFSGINIDDYKRP